MTSRRPYRKPVSIAEARREIRRCSDTQFDPQVATALTSLYDADDPGYLAQEPAKRVPVPALGSISSDPASASGARSSQRSR